MIQSPFRDHACRDHECIRRLIGVVLVVVLACSAATQAEGRNTSQADGERASAHNDARTSEDPRPVALDALGQGHVEFVPTANVVLHSERGVAGAPPAVAKHSPPAGLPRI